MCAKRAQTLVSDDELLMALCEEPGELGQLLAVTSREELVSDLENGWGCVLLAAHKTLYLNPSTSTLNYPSDLFLNPLLFESNGPELP